MYRIGDFSRLTQTPIKTLRYYDEIELLRPARVERSTGYRYYTAVQVERLNRIAVYKDLGFSLREIRILVADDVPIDLVRGMLRRKHDELELSAVRERERVARASALLELLEGQPGAHEVAVRDHGPRLVASVRGMLSRHEECERLFEELALEIGIDRRRQGQRGAIWHACVEGAVDCEAFLFLTSPVRGRGRVRVYELPGQRVASLVYRGDEDYLGAYRAMRAWLAASGAALVGSKREVFLEEGDGDSPPVTEIQFPIAAAPARAN